MPMPIAAPSKTARNRVSVACRASRAALRADIAERAMASCSERVRSRRAAAKPAASACWSRAQRARASSGGELVDPRPAVQDEVGLDHAEAAAEGVRVGAVRGDQGGADLLGGRRVEVPARAGRR